MQRQLPISRILSVNRFKQWQGKQFGHETGIYLSLTEIFQRESSDDDQTTHWPAAFNEPTPSPQEKSKTRNDFRQSVNSSTAGKREEEKGKGKGKGRERVQFY